MPNVPVYAMKSKLATILRRMADRLAPAAAGDCGSGTTCVSFTADVPAGVASLRPIIYATDSAGNVISDCRFESGEGWSPA